MNEKTTIKAPAKINIGLRITGTREDGYHTLESVFQMISLFDEITMEYPVKKTEVVFTGPYGGGIDPFKNSVYGVWKLLKEKFPALPFLRISVRKNIPHGSGLGGGSSDAAAVASFLWDRFNLPLDKEELSGLLTSLGADMPFFLNGPTALVEGIGDIITPIKFFNDYKIILFYPEIAISTPLIYKKYDLFLTPRRKNIIFKALLRRVSDFEGLTCCFYNDLEPVVKRLHPRFDEINEALERAGCKYVQMSGSGSVVFGLYKDRYDKKALKGLDGTVFECEPLKEPVEWGVAKR